MKKKTNKLLILTSILLGVWLMFFTWHWILFLIGSIIASCSIYFLANKTVLFYNNIINKNYTDTLKNIIQIILLIILIGVLWLTFIASGSFTGKPMPHLRSNVFTGECSLNEYTDQADYWYYRYDSCNIPSQNKIELIKNDHRFNYIKTQCELELSSDNIAYRLSWDEVTCNDLLK